MIRSELVCRLAEKCGLGRLAAEAVVNAVFDAIIVSLKDRERVEIRGFGTLFVRQYPGYRGRNPKTGAAIEVRPKRLPHFKPGKAISDALNRANTVTSRPIGGRPGTLRGKQPQPTGV